MAIDLTSNGSRVGVRLSGFCETFKGSEGDHVSGRWVDFKDLAPYNFSRVKLSGDGAATTTDVVLQASDGETEPIPGGAHLAGHWVIGREMGSANGEITVEWDLPEALHFFHQIGPAFGLDLTGQDDVTKWGVAHVWDISLTFTAGYSYTQNVFSDYLPWIFGDPARVYRIQGDKISTQGDTVLVDGDPVPGTGATFRGTWNSGTAYNEMDIVESGSNSYRCLQAHTNQPLPSTPTKGFTPDTAYWSHLTTRRWSATTAEANAGYNEGPYPPGVGQNGETDLLFDNYPTTVQITTRVVDGWYKTWVDGVPMHNATPVPSWAIGRDGWGVHVIQSTWIPGQPFPFGTYPEGNYNGRVSKIFWRPYDTPLV